jgi:hypothetical protein
MGTFILLFLMNTPIHLSGKMIMVTRPGARVVNEHSRD